MEWKVLQGLPSHVQKVLNQWKHKYYIHIHGMTSNGDIVTILLQREIIE